MRADSAIGHHIAGAAAHTGALVHVVAGGAGLAIGLTAAGSAERGASDAAGAEFVGARVAGFAAAVVKLAVGAGEAGGGAAGRAVYEARGAGDAGAVVHGEHVGGAGSEAGVGRQEIAVVTEGAGSVAADGAVESAGEADLVVADAPAAYEHAEVVFERVAGTAVYAVCRRAAAGARSWARDARLRRRIGVRFDRTVWIAHRIIEVKILQALQAKGKILAIHAVTAAKLAEAARNKRPNWAASVAHIQV